MSKDPEIYCDYDGFTWIWIHDQKKWVIDLFKSGGPPSPHEQAPKKPPFKIKPLKKKGI